MNGTAPILEKQIGARSAAPARGSNATAADFRAALANASDAAGSVEGRPSTDRGKHVVKAGDTLYGIARARLAQAGQPATPGAAMRYALQIASANQIRNPDRIHIGQQLDLAGPFDVAQDRPAATINGGSAAATSGARSTVIADGTGIRALREVDLQDRIEEANAEEDAGEHACDPVDCAPRSAALPAAERITAAGDDVRDRPDRVASSRADLALYQHAAPTAAPKPPGELPDIVYKGVIGKALDQLPLEPSTRTGLQQANAIISSSFAARSLATLTGVGGPLLTIAGLVWGLFSAQKISAMQPAAPKQVAQSTSAETVR